MNVGLDFLTALGIIGLAAVWGRRVVGWADPGCPLSQRWLLGTGVGLGGLALLTFGLGWAQVLYRPVAWGLLVALAALAGREWRICGQELRQLAQRLRLLLDTRFHRLLWGVVGIHILFNLTGSLAPPTHGDDLCYHLTIAKRYIEAHGFVYMPHEWRYQLFFNIDALTLLGMLLRSHGVPLLMNWMLSLLILGALLSLAWHTLPRDRAVLAGTLFYTSLIVAVSGASANVDLGGTFFVLLAALAFGGGLQRPGTRWRWLLGLLAGLAASTKMTLLPTIPLVVALLAFLQVHQRRPLREWLRPALEFSVLAVGVAAPWYLKRWVETGNPFFPLWYGVLGGRDWSPELQAPFERGMFYWYGMRKTWWTFVWSPWAMTMAG